MANRKKKAAPGNAPTAKAGHDSAKHADEKLDACDLKLTEAEATPDEDLPAAEGGVA